MRRNHLPAVEIQMPSSVDECSRLRKVVCRLASAAFRDPSAIADVELAVGEAFSNAVKYGDENGKVSVRVETSSRRRIAVQVDYPGSNFDTTVRFPQDVLNAEGGFGRFIMRQTMDSMEYFFEGNHTTLRMTKRDV